jgi:RNA polymerase sigma-70 factor, ECF subfamily
VEDSDSARERFIAYLTSSQDALYAYILSIFPHEDLAKDILQETNIVLWRRADQYDQQLSFLAWACGIARFQVKARRRDMQRTKIVFDNDLVDTLAVEAQQYAVEDDAMHDMLNGCLDELPPAQRELIVQRYGPSGSIKMLAAKLGRSASGLTVTLFRIRRALVDCLKRKMKARDNS